MFKKILTHKFISALSLVSCLLSLSGIAWAWVALGNVADATPLVLHFNDMHGITHVGGFAMLAFMGIFGVVIAVANGFVAVALDERDAVLGKMVAVLTLVFSILLFIGFASIISVN
jgi:hypothetical protein